jgi:hypothetical protein
MKKEEKGHKYNCHTNSKIVIITTKKLFLFDNRKSRKEWISDYSTNTKDFCGANSY